MGVCRTLTDVYDRRRRMFRLWTTSTDSCRTRYASACARTAQQRYRMVVARARLPRSRRHPGVSRVDGTVHRRGLTADSSSSSSSSGRFTVRSSCVCTRRWKNGKIELARTEHVFAMRPMCVRLNDDGGDNDDDDDDGIFSDPSGRNNELNELDEFRPAGSTTAETRDE